MMVADQLAQVALSRDEGDDRNRPVRSLRLDELGEFRSLVGDEVDVAGPRREPEDQLVEEQHDRVVSESLRVLAHDEEPAVEVEKGLALRQRDIAIGGESMRR